MALTPRLELRQSQSLVMTPQLQQAIKLLQLSNLELGAYVERELERNPLLESDDGEPPLPGEPAEPADPEPAAESEEPRGIDFSEAGGATAAQEAASALDVDYDNLWNNDSPAEIGSGDGGEAAFADWGRGGNGGFEDREPDLEQTLSHAETLRDHLIQQLNIEITDPADRLIGLYLIDLLDEAGYLAAGLAGVAAALGCDPARVEAVLALLQTFDPPGVFARSLAECLAIQLREKDRFDPAMAALVGNLELLARRDAAQLQRICGVDAEDLAAMVAEIRALDPKPARSFDHEVAQPVTPDVLMRAAPGGGWVVELNSETLPRVLVNNRYHALVSRNALSREDRVYINECLQSANWLVKSLHQRATTIIKVASAIVGRQEDFFARGVEYLRPLVLRDIAGAIEMHESTVSRVTSNKFIATPRGVFELKYFFTTAIARSDGGQAHSAEAVRHHLKALIDAEKPDDVLSDDRLVEILRADGIDIARRTVAKYRESLGIPSSMQRRREKVSGF